MRLVLLIAALLVPSVAQASDGPPPPLAGVPIELDCEAKLAIGHPITQTRPGEDLAELAEKDGSDDSLEWLDGMLCDRLWTMLEAAGAHPTPPDVRLPARAVLTARLDDLQISGSRIVDQRIGGSILQVAVPHWSLAVRWSMSFAIHYAGADGEDDVLSAPPLNLGPRAGAEQDDYAPLKLSALLEVTAVRAFEPVPRIISDDGRLGDLFFARVDRPPHAPEALQAPDALAAEFWQLLLSEPKHRHDALAFHLGSEQIPLAQRLELAYWFLLNDSNPTLRKDALSWLLRTEHPPGADLPLSARMEGTLRWLLARDGSPRMRARVVDALEGRATDDIRSLLILASTDRSPDVSERALGALRRFAAPTSAEYVEMNNDPAPPALASWTSALDGRVPTPTGNTWAPRLELAEAAGGAPAETWIVRWLRGGKVEARDLEWAMPTWQRLLASPSLRLRRATIERLSRETGREEARALLAGVIANDAEEDLRVEALQGIGSVRDPDAKAAVMKATEDPEPRVRRAAADALQHIAGRPAEVRLEALRDNDPDPKVRRKARTALRKRAKAARS